MTLPSIHHLHPNLPPASAPLQQISSGYASQPLPTYLASAASPGNSPSTRKAPYDSDPEEPPKKKRRRQALSCTECKRRKIKCDRAQPCGPCARRGEQHKCQWHIIEPMEKYVTRAEFDELKSRVDELESILTQVAPHLIPSHPSQVPGPSSTMPLTPGPPVDPIQGTAITPYHQAPITTGPGIYHNIIPSLRSSTRGDPPPSPHGRLTGPSRSPLASYRQTPLPPGPPPPRPMPPSQPQIPPPLRSSSISPAVSSSSRLPPTSSTSRTSVAASRRASLSVPNLITPNPPDMASQNRQSKNLRAQAPPPLGQRLRPIPVHSGSAPHMFYPLLPPILKPIAVVP
ncbi:unnamed protein product [Somion occarium]